MAKLITCGTCGHQVQAISLNARIALDMMQGITAK